MPDFQHARFSDHGQGLFSPAEIERLMRAEFDRAQRHKYPIVCMMIAVDRLGQLQDLYGYESKDEILNAVIAVLRAETRDSDYLSILQDDRLLAVFPHTAPESGAFLAKRMLSGMKKQRFERDGRSLRISSSIGIAHNRHEGTLSFETLVRVAEEGLRVADAAGGDRFVETELYQLFEKKRRAEEMTRERQELFAVAGGAAPPAPFSAAPSAPPVQPANLLGETVLEILAAQGIQIDSLAGLDRETIARVIKEFQDARSRSAAPETDDPQETIDLLERRIAKLTHALGVTEEELKRVAALKNIDLGLASVYRSVQGLSDDALNKERKREMMREIFHANYELKKRLAPASGPPAGSG